MEEKAMAPHSSTLAWKIPWMEEPGRLQSMGSVRVRHDRDFTFTFHFHALEKEMATHSSVLAWRIPGTGEPGGLPSMGSHRVRHDWNDLAAAVAAKMGNAFWGIIQELEEILTPLWNKIWWEPKAKTNISPSSAGLCSSDKLNVVNQVSQTHWSEKNVFNNHFWDVL